MELSMELSALSRSVPVIASDDLTKKYVRRKEAKEKAMCELLKTQSEMEKVNSGTLTGTKFCPLISEKLKESGIDKTPAQCSRYWYAWARHRRECKDTLQFTSRSNTSSASIPDTGTDYIQSAQSLGVQTRLRSRPPWTDEEHNRLVELLKERRALESKDESLEKLSNHRLFALISKQLKQYLIEKSAGACTLYWSNKGFARSGFDINSPALSRQGRNVRESSVLRHCPRWVRTLPRHFPSYQNNTSMIRPSSRALVRYGIPFIVQLCAEHGH
jgi:hypothetical protein